MGKWKKIIFIVFMACVLAAPKAMAQAEGEICGPGQTCDPGLICNVSSGPGTGTCEPGGLPNCTADFQPPQPSNGQGIFSSIVSQIISILNTLSKNMFLGITGDKGFQTAITALLTLYIAVYGILFTFGMVQVTLFDFAMRVIKIAIVAMLVGGNTAWLYFSSIVIPFFQQSTYTIINWVTSIAVGGVSIAMPAGCPFYTNGQIDPSCIMPPFAVLDQAIAKAVSANTVVMLVTVLTTGPYGPLIGLLLLLATGAFLKMMITALWVYAMSLILQALLFGLAPIFLAFILFNRTRHLFDGWLNQLVNALLQPVLLFTFLAFFVTLIKACLDSLLGYNICWTRLPVIFAGTPLGTEFWRFNLVDANGVQMPSPQGLATGVNWGFNGPVITPPFAPKGIGQQPVFPIPIMLPLIYWVLVDLCSRFVDVCIDIARNLAGASTDLRMGMESMGSWFASASAGGSGGSGADLFGGKGVGGGGGGILGAIFPGGFGGGGGGGVKGSGKGGITPKDGSGAGGNKGSNPQEQARERTPGVNTR